MSKYEEFWIKLQDDISNALQTAYNQGFEDGQKQARNVRPRKRMVSIRIVEPAQISDETKAALYRMGRRSHGEE